MQRTLWLAALIVLALPLATGAAHADSQVLFDSDSGDYIGGGQRTTYTSGISISASGGAVVIQVPTQSTGFTLNFAVPDNVQGFPVGNYGGAERAAFRSPRRPGIDIYGDGRGCNTIVGWFRVLEAQFDSTGKPLQLAIDFKQNCEGFAAALYGAVRFNSTLPLSVAGPYAIAGPAAEASEGAQVSLDSGQSFERSGAGLNFQWLQQSGMPVQLVNSTSAGPSFVAPTAVPLGGSDLVFQLQVSDAGNATDTDTVHILVRSKSDRQNYVEFTSQSGDYIGGGRSYHFDLSNTAFTFSGGQNGAHLGIDSDALWTIDMVPASGTPFTVGAYENAQRYPFQGSVPGLDVSGDGRGCNTLTGRFDVTQAVTNAAQAITAFGADFTQHCEGQVPALSGVIRYNYLDPHVPTALAGPAQTVMAGQTATLDGSASTDPLGTLVSYQWTQTQGPSVTFDNAAQARPSFVAPAVSSAQNLVFSLLVTDDQGYMAKAVTQVTDQPSSSSSSSSSGGSSSSSSSSSGSSSGSGSGSGGGAFGAPLLGMFSLLALLRRKRHPPQ